MAIVLDIYTLEADDATDFRIYDQTDWTAPAFDWTQISLIDLNVLYDGDTYTLRLYKTGVGAVNLIGLDATYTNLFGVSVNSHYHVDPTQLLYGTTPLTDEFIPDGFYEITISMTYTAVVYTDTCEEGYLAETYQMASQLPLQIDIDNFNYEENRIQFLIIAMLPACKWAAELSRPTQFEKFTDKINSLLDARSISTIWTL
jgi:hypothetical protein